MKDTDFITRYRQKKGRIFHRKRAGLVDVYYGVTRTVYLVGSIAIKIPSFFSWDFFLRGILANIYECGRWGYYFHLQLGYPELKHPLCPVLYLAPLGLFVIQRRAIQPRNFTDKHLNRYKKQLRRNPYTSDFKTENFGFIGRRLVCLDYGGSA